MQTKTTSQSSLPAAPAECTFVIPCTEETANEVWMMIRKEIMDIDPDLIFRSRRPVNVETMYVNDKASAA